MFIDASDYGWAAVLCQRPEPGKAPLIIAEIAKGFTDVSNAGRRWSENYTLCGKEWLDMNA